MTYYFYEPYPGVIYWTEDIGAVPEGMEYVESELPERPEGQYRLIIEDGSVKWAADPQQQPEPTKEEDVDSMLVDHEYRLTLLELGI